MQQISGNPPASSFITEPGSIFIFHRGERGIENGAFYFVNTFKSLDRVHQGCVVLMSVEKMQL